MIGIASQPLPQLFFLQISIANKQVTIPTTKLKICMPLNPNCAKGNTISVKNGLPQWLSNHIGCSNENLAIR